MTTFLRSELMEGAHHKNVFATLASRAIEVGGGHAAVARRSRGGLAAATRLSHGGLTTVHRHVSMHSQVSGDLAPPETSLAALHGTSDGTAAVAKASRFGVRVEVPKGCEVGGRIGVSTLAPMRVGHLFDAEKRRRGEFAFSSVVKCAACVTAGCSRHVLVCDSLLVCDRRVRPPCATALPPVVKARARHARPPSGRLAKAPRDRRRVAAAWPPRGRRVTAPCAARRIDHEPDGGGEGGGSRWAKPLTLVMPHCFCPDEGTESCVMLGAPHGSDRWEVIDALKTSDFSNPVVLKGAELHVQARRRRVTATWPPRHRHVAAAQPPRSHQGSRRRRAPPTRVTGHASATQPQVPYAGIFCAFSSPDVEDICQVRTHGTRCVPPPRGRRVAPPPCSAAA